MWLKALRLLLCRLDFKIGMKKAPNQITTCASLKKHKPGVILSNEELEGYVSLLARF
jgi:hypothetical protein